LTSGIFDLSHILKRTVMICIAYAAASAGCALARRARVTSLPGCICWSSWSILHWNCVTCTTTTDF